MGEGKQEAATGQLLIEQLWKGIISGATRPPNSSAYLKGFAPSAAVLNVVENERALGKTLRLLSDQGIYMYNGQSTRIVIMIATLVFTTAEGPRYLFQISV